MTTFNPLSPTDVGAYLRTTGWIASETRGRWKVFEKDFEGGRVEIEVPMISDAPDYPRLVRRMLEDLSRLEDRPIEVLERDARSSAFDVISLRLKGSLQNGRIPVEHGAHVFHATRDLLLAAACSTIYPTRSTFSRRKPQAAMDYLRTAKFAPAEAGSFVVAIETTIPPRLKNAPTELVPGDGATSEAERPAPFARNVGLRLESGASRARRLVDEIGADGSSDGLIASVADGVTSNLCEAIARLVAPEIAESMELTFRWSGLWPSPRPTNRIVFGSNTNPTLLAMAVSLRDVATYDDCVVFGPVRALKSNSVDAGGTVQLMMVDEPARWRKVSIDLDPRAYMLAHTAHGDDSWFSCTGELIKTKGAYYLLNPRNPSIIPQDEEISGGEDGARF